jgi:hypothetical protein
VARAVDSGIRTQARQAAGTALSLGRDSLSTEEATVSDKCEVTGVVDAEVCEGFEDPDCEPAS